MTVATPKLEPRRVKRTRFRPAMSEALSKRLSLWYLDLIMRPVPEDLKSLLLKLDFTDPPSTA